MKSQIMTNVLALFQQNHEFRHLHNKITSPYQIPKILPICRIPQAVYVLANCQLPIASTIKVYHL